MIVRTASARRPSSVIPAKAGIHPAYPNTNEAARATGMSYARGMRHIVVPQMLGFVLPPTANQTLSLVKESAILSTITVSEMTYTALRIQGETFSPFEAFLMVAALYWLPNEVIATVIRHLERRSERARTRAVAVGRRPAAATSLRS